MNEWIKDIQDRIKGVPVSSGRSKKIKKVNFDDIVFAPAQLSKIPKDYYKEEINTKTIIGKNSKRPIEISVPIVFGGMSFGALSKEAKIILAKASSVIGTLENTGEGGLLPEEREFSKKLIIQYSSSRFGISEEVLKKADAIEIKIGQGAKPGMGGMLPKTKVTQEIAEIRKTEVGKDLHSPAYHADIKNIKDLKKKVDWLRELSQGVPIIIKMAAGNVENDVKLAVFANPDIIAIDGIGGGTGIAPQVMIDEVGIPTVAVVAQAKNFLEKIGAKQELWIGGGLNKGSDFAKALALGADVVFVATPLLITMGCVYCRLCHLGKCPAGIATQEPELRKRIDIDSNVKNLVNYINSCKEEMKMIAGACGESDVHSLNKNHIRALSRDIADMTKIKMVGN
ncbi:FMN-binding glutamate synthase family protein [Patescibacteria group bacterium]